jgi:hypothetical protein
MKKIIIILIAFFLVLTSVVYAQIRTTEETFILDTYKNKGKSLIEKFKEAEKNFISDSTYLRFAVMTFIDGKNLNKFADFEKLGVEQKFLKIIQNKNLDLELMTAPLDFLWDCMVEVQKIKTYYFNNKYFVVLGCEVLKNN